MDTPVLWNGASKPHFSILRCLCCGRTASVIGSLSASITASGSRIGVGSVHFFRGLQLVPQQRQPAWSVLGVKRLDADSGVILENARRFRLNRDAVGTVNDGLRSEQVRVFVLIQPNIEVALIDVN
jgi:hypothetical protein